MKIGLIDVDSHSYPNLALMKISAYHKSLGDDVELWNGFRHYDIVYKSKVFTDEYSQDENTCIKADKIVEGGTGYNLENKLPDKIEHVMPDYGIYNNPRFKDTAIGFLTRGCPRRCPFCIVGQKEGISSHQVSNLSEFWNGQRNIELLDPNLLACKEHETLLKQLICSKSTVNFSQGLDARIINTDNSVLISRIKIKMIHFAFDNPADEKIVTKGLKTFKKMTTVNPSKVSVYILTNFNTTLRQDLYRVRLIQRLGYMPDIRIFNKSSLYKTAKENPKHQLLLWLQRWANNRFIYKSVDFFEYRPRKDILIKDFIRKHGINLEEGL